MLTSNSIRNDFEIDVINLLQLDIVDEETTDSDQLNEKQKFVI